MANLTSFTLGYIPSEEISIRQLLDFFEEAPRLQRVELNSATPTSGAQGGRLVSLVSLKRMNIQGGGFCSLLLDHLLIPVGAKLAIRMDSVSPRFEGHLPRYLDNLRNLSNFTEINLKLGDFYLDTRFSGPNGRVSLSSVTSLVELTHPAFEYLAQVDTSKTERLEIHHGKPPSRDLPYRVLVRMKNLRALTLSRCQNSHIFIHALHPDTGSSGDVTCPKLEELDIVLHNSREAFDIKTLINVATARALGGAQFRTVRIVGGHDKLDPGDVLAQETRIARGMWSRG